MTPKRAYQVIAVLIGVGLLVALGFSLNALFSSRAQQPSQPVSQPEAEEQPPSTSYDTSQVSPSAGWMLYRNEEYGFQVKYPKGWKIADEHSGEAGSSLLFAVAFRDPALVAYEGGHPLFVHVVDKGTLKGKGLEGWLKERDTDFPYEVLEHDVLFGKSTVITKTHDIYGFALHEAWIHSGDYLYRIGVSEVIEGQDIETLKKVLSAFKLAD